MRASLIRGLSHEGQRRTVPSPLTSEGSARNSSHVHRLGPSISPTTLKCHRSRGVRGVGPAESTGKPSSTYWPGGAWRCRSVCGGP